MKNFGTEQSFLLGGVAKKQVPGNWSSSWSKYFELLLDLTLVVTVLIASFSKRIMSKVEQELGWFGLDFCITAYSKLKRIVIVDNTGCSSSCYQSLTLSRNPFVYFLSVTLFTSQFFLGGGERGSDYSWWWAKQKTKKALVFFDSQNFLLHFQLKLCSWCN